MNAENFLLPLCRLRVQSPGNGDLGALFHKREKYLEALGFQCVLCATHFTIVEKAKYNQLTYPLQVTAECCISEGLKVLYSISTESLTVDLKCSVTSQQGYIKKSRNKQLSKHFINISWPHTACSQVKQLSFVNNGSCILLNAAELHNSDLLFLTLSLLSCKVVVTHYHIRKVSFCTILYSCKSIQNSFSIFNWVFQIEVLKTD